MRASTPLLLFAALGTVLGGAGFALADDASGEENHSDAATTDRAAERRAAADARRAALQDAREAALADFRLARADAIADFRAAHAAAKDEFLLAKKNIIQNCRAENAEDDEARAQCVRDGVRPLIEAARAKHAAAAEEYHAKVLAARHAALDAFAAARSDAYARHGRPDAASHGRSHGA